MKKNQTKQSTFFDWKNLGALIKAFRKENGYTQANIAEQIGITTQHYSRIERGEYTPSLQTFFCLVNLLNLDISSLNLNSTNKISSTTYEIVLLLQNLSQQKQKAVLTFLQSMDKA
ncbi:MAG: helix-turn-helix domain-containing protein [Candidatus Gastranaerophilales bacterium]|nr:helix-turn-helix domain-containing protein [Candidatus Gastranaerophilales bacterium]